MTRSALRCLLLSLTVVAPACGGDAPLVQPVVRDGPSPFHYPLALWDRGVQGETTLLLRVDEDGAVDSAAVFRSSGHEAMDSAAVAGASGLRFVPAHQGGTKRSAWVKVPVRFRIDPAAAGDTALPPPPHN